MRVWMRDVARGKLMRWCLVLLYMLVVAVCEKELLLCFASSAVINEEEGKDESVKLELATWSCSTEKN